MRRRPEAETERRHHGTSIEMATSAGSCTTAEARTWRVGIIGVNTAGLFLLERIGLASNICLVGAFDLNPSRLHFAAEKPPVVSFGTGLLSGVLTPTMSTSCS